MEKLTEYFQIFLLSILPITEARGAIPYGIFFLKLNPLNVFLISLFGNILVPMFLLNFLEKIFLFLEKRFPLVKKFLSWISKRTDKKFSPYHQKWKNFGLCLFVAIPLPLTGAWSGSLAAFLFGIKKIQAIIFISLGVLIASILVFILTILGVKIEKIFGYQTLAALILVSTFFWAIYQIYKKKWKK